MNPRRDEKAGENRGETFDIFTVLGHDLKSPLNAVESYLEIIRGKVLGDEIDPYMTILENSIARLHQMRELITDVVDWSRIQEPGASRAPGSLDLSGTARRILDRYLKESQARNVSVSAEIEDNLVMKAVSREIELILRHLVDNAIKYNRDNGTVRVTLKKADRMIALKVSDTGIGMASEDQALLFREFMRIKNSATQDIRGTGLGLAIVKKLVDLYQGSVQVESETDKGASFSLHLSCGD